MPGTVNLTTKPEIVDLPATHCVFIERVDNIPANAPEASSTTPAEQNVTAILFPLA